MGIVDTVYLVAYFRPSDPLHGEAVRILEGLVARGEARVSAAALLELDLIMKSRGFSSAERGEVWSVVGVVVGDAVEPLLPADFQVAARLEERFGLDYFDALIAAQCINRKAKPLTADREIVRAVEGWEGLG